MVDIVKEGWGYIVGAPSTDYEMISTAFNTCDPVASDTDLKNLYTHLMNGYAYLAMTNYPYETSFLEPMPAWPVKESAKFFDNITPPPS
jgi:lysosomal Pro-X carboxypeptidase